MTRVVERLAREAREQITAEPDSVWTRRIEVAVAEAIRAALREAVNIARSQRYSSHYQADPDTCERIAVALENVAKQEG